jgi:hypothetical protein
VAAVARTEGIDPCVRIPVGHPPRRPIGHAARVRSDASDDRARIAPRGCCGHLAHAPLVARAHSWLNSLCRRTIDPEIGPFGILDERVAWGVVVRTEQARRPIGRDP